MSGGVDSSVAALLLRDEGYEVVGVYMKCWDGLPTPEGVKFRDQCAWKEERRDAMRVAAKIKIPFLTYDFVETYRQQVVEYFFREFEKGNTPNPDVMCNREIKFKVFLEQALKDGADFIATGHYAKRENDHVLKAKDKTKDQSYFLWTLTQAQIQKTLFPLGDSLKTEVRAIAREHDLPVADKKDSQGICFIGKVSVNDFLKARIPEVVGPVMTVAGKRVGEHAGAAFYTVGQRHGLKIPSSLPYYVTSKDVATNTVIVAEGQGDDALYGSTTQISQTSWLNEAPEEGRLYGTKIRYRQPDEVARFAKIGDTSWSVEFDKPQRAITRGQSLVVYDGDRMIGGGVIL